MASRYGKAKWKPLSSKQTQPAMKAHDIVCAHTMVGYLTSTNAMFRKNGYGGTESHYGLGGKWGGDKVANLDGELWQWQSRAHTADANLDGKYRVISIESADSAPSFSSDLPRWTPKQAAKLIDLIAWECSLAAHAACPSTWTCRKGVVWNGVRVAIPPVLIPDTKKSRRGLAVHRQGVKHSLGLGKVKGYLVAGGEKWSTATGKECPGNARVQQFEDEIIPAVQARLKAPVKPAAPKPPKQEEVADVTKKELQDAIIEVLTTAEIVPNKPTAEQLKKDPTLKTTYYTVIGALANVELDQDSDRDSTRADRGQRTTEVQEVKAMLAALMAMHGTELPEGVKAP
jgi:hypothetical protein